MSAYEVYPDAMPNVGLLVATQTEMYSTVREGAKEIGMTGGTFVCGTHVVAYCGLKSCSGHHVARVYAV